MKETTKIIVAMVIISVLVTGVAYAAIQNITLNITGTATADPAQANFTVMFSGDPTVSDGSKVTAAKTDDTNATINVSGLTAKDESVTATYTIQNTSKDLSADLSAVVSNNNTDYFEVTYDFDAESIEKGEATTLTVTVKLIKTPIDKSETATIGLQITAEPVQPQ